MDAILKGYGILDDPNIESAIPDSIIRSESAENDYISKLRLHSLTLRLSHLINDLESKSVSSDSIPDLRLNLTLTQALFYYQTLE